MPSIGAFDIIGASADDCFGYADRFGAYMTLLNDSRNLHSAISWAQIDLHEVQKTCITRNKHRFEDVPPSTRAMAVRRPRTAIVLRAYESFNWTEDDMVNVRAMMTELSLYTGGEYQVFVLLHVRDKSEVEPNGDAAKVRYVPKSFLNMTEVWNYTDCEMEYPKVGEYE